MTNGDILEQSGLATEQPCVFAFPFSAGAGVVAPILVRSYASRSDLFRAMARRGGAEADDERQRVNLVKPT